jgi:diguanylate cyclase (GGDEF)-like protein
MGFLNRKSLQAHSVALGATAVLCTSVAAGLVIASTWISTRQQAAALDGVALRLFSTLLLAALASAVLIHRFQRSARQHEEAKRDLKARRRTVDQLLEFSQTVQGAGKPEQIFDALSYFLRSELGLAGLVILAHDPETLPATQVKARWPDDVLNAEPPVSEMDTTLCPCLRQCLPKHFRSDGSPVRCAVDASMRLGADHAAYCIPFTLGRRQQVLVHMLMPPGASWSEEQRQLAQTYVNTANSSLISLHMLSEAEKQSMTDPLTGLYNRRSMEQLLSREVALAERHGHALSVVMIDMDKFKEINDAHGHAAGDHMLKAFADCVRFTLRKTDLAFRYGGDEFVIALPQTALAQAQQVVNKVRQAYAAVDFSSAIANLQQQPTLSIGVAERSQSVGILTLPQLLQAADSALYDAKSGSRNCIRTYQPPRAA